MANQMRDEIIKKANKWSVMKTWFAFPQKKLLQLPFFVFAVVFFIYFDSFLSFCSGKMQWKGLRYHGTPKLTMFSKNTLLSFSDRYYSNLSFTKSFRKKDCFYAKLWTKKDLWH